MNTKPIISIMNRNEFETLPAPNFKHAAISIKTPGHEDTEFVPGPHCTGVLRLCFHDVDNSNGHYNQILHLFDKDHAKKIWEFVDSLDPATELLIIHCDAGVSRSPAVAAAIMKAWGEDDEYFFKRYLPNRYVYRLLLNIRDEPART